MGADVWSVLMLLSSKFLKLTGIAVLIALPFAYLTSKQWLETYAYRIELPWYFFVLPALILFLVAFGTIATQTLRVAKQNPVEVLRHE